MAFVPVPDCVMVELRCLLDGQKVENTLYFRKTGGWESGDYTALATALRDWWIASLGAQMSSDVSLRSIMVTDLESETAPALEFTDSLPHNAAVGSGSLPNNVAMAVKFSTLERGRSSRGRNYFFGIIETLVTGNTIAPALAGAVVDAYLELVGETILPAGVNWVVVSRYHDNAPRVTGIAGNVTGVSVTDLIVDSQRRRLPGRGS